MTAAWITTNYATPSALCEGGGRQDGDHLRSWGHSLGPGHRHPGRRQIRRHPHHPLFAAEEVRCSAYDHSPNRFWAFIPSQGQNQGQDGKGKANAFDHRDPLRRNRRRVRFAVLNSPNLSEETAIGQAARETPGCREQKPAALLITANLPCPVKKKSTRDVVVK